MTEKASVENAIAATTGAPSPWKVFASTASEPPNRASRGHTSDLLKLEDMMWNFGCDRVDIDLSYTLSCVTGTETVDDR